MTTEEQRAKRHAYYLANREKYLQRSREQHATRRQESLDYQSRYYHSVTKYVRRGFPATTPIRGEKSHRRPDKKKSANPRNRVWAEGVPVMLEPATIDWAS
jgi:hypothetical protein